MSNKRDIIIDNILAWGGVATVFILAILPYLQFIAVCLAIAVSIKTLRKKK